MMEDANVWKQIVPDDEPQAEPKVAASFHTEDAELIGTTSAPIKKVEVEDDGSIHVFIDHWPQAEPKREQTCLWSRADDDTDVWETGCGHAFTIIDGTLGDNHMEFCCYCGRPLEQEIGGSDE